MSYNTRSSIRGSNSSLNSSRGRGKVVTTPIISIDNQNPLSSRPKVQRTPPPNIVSDSNRTAVNLNTQFEVIAQQQLNPSRNLNTPSRDPNISPQQTISDTVSQTTTFPSDRTERQLLEESFQNLNHSSIEDLLVPTGFIDNQARILSHLNMEPNTNTGNENTANVQTPTANSIESLITLLQQTIRSTQDEMRTELTAIKQSISNITSREQTLPSTSYAQSSSQSSNIVTTPMVSTKFEKWKINFDGSGSVSDFLFKVDTLCERTQCSDEHLMANFHIFLSGKAESWFWNFIKQNRNAQYSFLKTSIIKEFGYLETDHEVLLRISNRKQQNKESYDDFHTNMISMNARMREPIVEKTLIDIIKRNVNTNLKLLLFNTVPKTLHELRDLARNAEKVLKETKVSIPNVNNSRQINELEVGDCEHEINDELIIDPQIEALQLPRQVTKPDYSKIKCWNCLSFGHSYIYCPEDTRHLFCFKCGQRGVNTTKCTNVHPGNRKKSEMATGDSRSKPKPPSSQ